MSAKEKNKDKTKITLVCSILFISCVLLFFLFTFLQDFIEVDWLKILLKILAMLSQIGFSTFGVTLALEFTSLRKTANETAREVADDLLRSSTQFDYMKDRYNNTYCRDLLYLSYMPHNVEITEDKKRILDSQGRILQKLVQSIYIDEDIMDVAYVCKDSCIYKVVTRKFTIINIYKLKEHFRTVFSYNRQQDKKEFELKYFKVNGNKVDAINKDVKSIDNTYDKSTELVCDVSKDERTIIEYKIKIKIAKDDKSSIYNSRYLTRKFEHNIEIEKSTGFNRCDVSIFSLLNSISETEERACMVDDVEGCNGNIKKRIYNNDWLFPSDGYILLFS